MIETDFELKPFTPLFSQGADRATDSLRGPSLKGQILWWYRALVGAFYSRRRQDGIEKVRDLSSGQFGAQSIASRLRITVHADHPGSLYPDRPYQRGTYWEPFEGFRYLAYGLEGRRYYDPLAPGMIRLRFSTSDSTTWRATIASLWLLSRFGGLGGRTRRGMGGFELSPVGTRNILPAGFPSFGPLPGASTAGEVSSALVIGLNQLIEWFAREYGAEPVLAAGGPSSLASSLPPEWSCFAPGFWSAAVSDRFSSDTISALDNLGIAYRDFRKTGPLRRHRFHLSDDFPSANSYESSGVPSPRGSKLGVFGLPLVFRFSSTPHAGSNIGLREAGVAAAITDQAENEQKDSRRASPLFLRVIRTADGKFWILAHVFKARFLKDAEELEFYFKKQTFARPPLPPTPVPAWHPPYAGIGVDWSNVERFLNTFGGSRFHV